MKVQNWLLGFASVLFLVLVPTTASAAIITVDTFANGAGPVSTSTLATISLSQNGSDVDFVITNSIANLGAAIGSNSYIDVLGLTFSHNTTLTPTSFTDFGGTQSPTIVASDFAINPGGNFPGGGGQNFFLELNFPSPNAQRFKDGETASWTITNVVVADFLSPIVSGNAGVPDGIAAIHIAGLTNGFTSASYVATAIPEPSSVIPLAVMGVAGASRRRSRRRHTF